MKQPNVIITRRSSLSASAKIYRVEIDGFACGKLKNGGSLAIPVQTGIHTLSFYCYGRCEKEVAIRIEENENLYIRARLSTWSAKIELEISKNPYAAERKDNNCVWKWICTALVSITILFMFVNQEAESTQMQSSLPTEPNLEILLEQAAEKFGAGDYEQGFSICSEIAEKFPDSETDNFVDEQLKQYTKISANDLMNAYETNIVNADKMYNEKVLIISGTVSKIGRTNNDKNICVLLRTSTLIGTVQLNFSKNQEDAVSALKPGDWITSIGECKGKSGKQLLVFDGSNVMIHDCMILH